MKIPAGILILLLSHAVLAQESDTARAEGASIPDSVQVPDSLAMGKEVKAKKEKKVKEPKPPKTKLPPDTIPRHTRELGLGLVSFNGDVK